MCLVLWFMCVYDRRNLGTFHLHSRLHQQLLLRSTRRIDGGRRARAGGQVCEVRSFHLLRGYLLGILIIGMGLCFSNHAENDKDSDDVTEFAGGNVHVVKTLEAWEAKLSEAKNLHKIVIANFSATWCGPCKVIAPYYRELSEKYPSLMFLVIDVDELVDFSTSWEIKATPTFFFLREGQQIDKLVGANKPELAKKITTIADSVPSQPK